MRGGAIPLLAWAALLLVLFIGNAVWNAKFVNAATAAFATIVIVLAAILVILTSGRRAVRPGPPEPDPSPQPIPQASTGAVLIGLSIATIVFGFAFGSFLVYFGAGLLVLSIGRTALELRAERESREHARAEQPR